jgi:hypothetical protein
VILYEENEQILLDKARTLARMRRKGALELAGNTGCQELTALQVV